MGMIQWTVNSLDGACRIHASDLAFVLSDNVE
jgi:hypothetical protein